MSSNSIFELLRADGSLTVNKALIHSIGLNESIIYCELISKYFYFESKGMLEANDTFYNSVNDLFLSTGIHEKSQRTAIKRLECFGLIATKVIGIPKKRYFKISFDSQLIGEFLSVGKKNIETLKAENELKTTAKLETITIPPKGVFECSPMELLRTPKGSLNNTNNNTKKNTNVKVIKGNYSKENFLLSLDHYLEVINYYFYLYEYYRKEEHPILTKDNWCKVMKVLNDIEDIEIEKELMKQYFNTNFDSDRNILHYISGDIRENRMYEVAY